MEVVFLLAAELDLFDAYKRYGENLLDKIDAAIEHVRNHPKIGTSFRGKFRRKLVMRSPFSVYYAVEGNRLVIHAVIDQRQDPDKISDRLTNL